MDETRQRGVVKWFSPEKGFGFISRNGEAKDIFVHFSGIRESADGYRKLEEGQLVEFEIGKGKKGPQAEDVVVCEE